MLFHVDFSTTTFGLLDMSHRHRSPAGIRNVQQHQPNLDSHALAASVALQFRQGEQGANARRVLLAIVSKHFAAFQLDHGSPSANLPITLPQAEWAAVSVPPA
jgi:hypothetical protein